MHVVNGFDNPLADNPRLQLSMKALQYKCGKTTEKLPITYHILERIFQYIDTNHDKQLVWSAMTLGFYGLLRAAEFTVPSQTKFNPSLHLTINDVSLRLSDSGTRFMSVMIKASKTDKTCKGYLVHIGCSGKQVCAVCAMSSYLASKYHKFGDSGPLYKFINGTVLTKPLFVTMTRTYLAMIGVNPAKYTGHSYRVGGATTAAEAGLNEWEIKLMGRWSSNAYQTYIKTSVDTIINFSPRIVNK